LREIFQQVCGTDHLPFNIVIAKIDTAESIIVSTNTYGTLDQLTAQDVESRKGDESNDVDDQESTSAPRPE
jgi:hypothetical protein